MSRRIRLPDFKTTGSYSNQTEQKEKVRFIDPWDRQKAHTLTVTESMTKEARDKPEKKQRFAQLVLGKSDSYMLIQNRKHSSNTIHKT